MFCQIDQEWPLDFNAQDNGNTDENSQKADNDKGKNWYQSSYEDWNWKSINFWPLHVLLDIFW